MPFEPGQTVGEYQILAILGAGGMGRVYRVRNVISDRVEAMKVLLPDFAAEPDLATRFIAEIRTLASLDHPNIAQLHTAFQVENQLVMMMEFVEGVTLEQRAQQSPIPRSDVVEYVLQTLAALSYAHNRGVVHRDIKPANLMVTSHGVLKIMDFGIAKSRTDNQLTRPGTTLGSVYYMSPEQVRGTTADARSDLYSVGIVLYELLSGRRPFEGDTTYGILNQQLNAPPRPPIEVNPQLSKGFNDLILFALAKDPPQRFQSAEAFRNALCAVAGKVPSTAYAVSAPVPFTAEPQPFSPGGNPPGNTAGAGDNPPFRPVLVPSAPPRPAAHRGIWVGLGALAVVALLAAAALTLPHFFRAGAWSNGLPAAQSSAGIRAAAPAEAPAVAPVSDARPLEQSPAARAPAPAPDLRPPSASSAVHLSQAAPRPGFTPAVQQSGAPDAATENPPPPPPSGPSPQEIEQAQDRQIQLDARASAISSSLDRLQQQQQADGFGLRQDIAAAATRMHAYATAVAAEMAAGSVAAAQHDMDKEEKELATLEKFFNR